MWIQHVKEEEATGYVAQVYRRADRRGGEVDGIIKAHSLNPTALRALMTFYNGVMHGDCAISLRRREMIAVTVSAINECHYWVRHHGEGLLVQAGDREWVERFKADYRAVALEPADRAMLDYVAKLTRTPAAMVEADVAALRRAGFDDRAILDINQITGFFAWCNRTVDGLGVELESYWPEQGGAGPDRG